MNLSFFSANYSWKQRRHFPHLEVSIILICDAALENVAS